MSKAGANDWKTPLGYYERAIAELKKAREEFQTELQIVRALQSSHANLKAELETTKEELQRTKAELHDTNQRLEKLENIVSETQEIANSARSEAKAAQDTANTTHSEVESVKNGIKSGTIVAQRAIMLQGKDDQHWMRFRKLDSVNHHCFQIWKSDDTWHDDIRVKAAIFLRARDDYHWMGCKYVDEKNYDVFYVWRWNNTWQSTVRVRAARHLL